VKPKVAVAMSGGVDSSVAAALLKREGFEVVGMMLRLWSEPGKEDSNRCCTPDAMAMARRVAAKLDVPFYAVDAKDVFRSSVVEAFLDGYARGLTPNPCLICNSQVRWEFLLDHALALGAERMATGHYVRLMAAEGGRMQVLRARDHSKDQSYVLCGLTQEKLGRALFPLGGYLKTEVRALAEELDLPSARRADSQDLCFLAGEDYRAFLRRNAPSVLDRSGPIVDRSGRLLGQHEGLALYTIGQRKGLGLSSAVPLYVLEKDVPSNALVVGEEQELGRSELVVDKVNWLDGAPPTGPLRVDVKVRYTAKEAAAVVEPRSDGSVHVHFDAPQRGVTPGQAAVIYDGDRLLGGGLIQ